MSERSPSGDSRETFAERRKLIKSVHERLIGARNLDLVMDNSGEEGLSRSFVVFGAANTFVPAPHVRVGLVPKARAPMYADVSSVRFRVPLLERGNQDDASLAERLFDTPDDFYPGQFLTNDIFVEISRNGELSDYLLTPQELTPYGGVAQNIEPLIDPEVWGHHFAVEIPDYADLTLEPEEVMDVLEHVLGGKYETFLQDNLRRSA